jgi:hypothetical protein
MGRTSKAISLLFVVILAVSSLIMVESAFAQSIPKPSVPEFTVQLTDRSYDEPPTYQKDPYTGQTVLIWAGGHVDNKTFDFMIKNQPFAPYKNADGKDVELYYKIRHKGQFEEWSTIFAPKEDIAQSSGSGSTSISFIVGEIKTQIGYYSLVNDPYNRPWDLSAVFTAVTESDWSNTQTITISDTSASTSTSTPNPTSPTTSTSQNPAPSVPEFSWLALLPLLASVLLVAVAIKRYKRLST